MARRILLISFCLAVAVAARGRERRCSDAQAQRAEAEAVKVRSWDDLHTSYVAYQHCDDGAVAEGYSESVARILVDHWRTLPRFAQIARKDNRFKRFVLSHVDASLNVRDVESVKQKARTQCPSGLQSICREFAQQADSALGF